MTSEKTWIRQRREHEYGLAAAVFCEQDQLIQAETIVGADCFQDRFLAAIYRIGCRLSVAGELTLPKLRAHLRADGWLAIATEAEAFIKLKNSLSSQVLWHANELRRLDTLERMRAVLEAAHQEVQSLVCNPNDLQEGVLAKLKGLQVDQADLYEHTLEVGRRVHKRHRKHFDSGSQESIGIGTGIPKLDKATGGYFPQQLWQIAARSFYGKTTFALNLVSHLAGKGQVPVYFASYEMSAEELQERLFAEALAIELGKFTRGELEERELDEIFNKMTIFEKMPLFIDEKPPPTVEGLAAKVNLAKRKDGIQVLVVDHIQIMPKRRGVERHEHLAQLARDFKNLAKEQELVVIILNQLNAQAQEDGEPTNLHFAAGKAVIESLDVSLLLHRQDESSEYMEVIISKNKKGALERIPMRFDGAYQRVEEWIGVRPTDEPMDKPMEEPTRSRKKKAHA
ncbi:MAG: DnaB-like helicase C-terminal domain-containing protein [bacterium]|nr:DnaB-like helicase C-terminal domain-containing protein [bacterium]